MPRGFYARKGSKGGKRKRAAATNGELLDEPKPKRGRPRFGKKEEDKDEDVVIDPTWELTDAIEPYHRGLVLRALALVKRECKSVTGKLETLSLPHGPVDLLESHRLVLQTQIKQAQEGGPMRFAVKSLRALNAGLNLCEEGLKRVTNEQKELGIEHPDDTEQQLTRLAALRRRVGVQREVELEDAEVATAVAGDSDGGDA